VNYHVTVKKQVMDFAAGLAPEPRRALKKGILGLAKEQGDIKALTDELAGWTRLRVGRHRIIFRYRPGKEIECVFAEERRLVYELFGAEIVRILGGGRS
jgi:mRNA interferase RelE/StbE